MHSEMLFSVYWQAREPRLLTLAYKHNMKTFTKNKTVQETKLEFGQSQLDASLPWHSLKLSAAIINRRPWFLSSDTSNQILTQTHLLKPIQCALKCCSRSVCKLESLDRFNFTRRWLSEQYTWRRFAKRKQNGTIHRQMWNRTESTRCTSAAVFGTRSLSLVSLLRRLTSNLTFYPDGQMCEDETVMRSGTEPPGEGPCAGPSEKTQETPYPAGSFRAGTLKETARPSTSGCG
jgi:hypothetical protein